MAIAPVASVTADPGANGGTTGAITTTGATLIVLSVGWWAGTTASLTVSDSKGNTYIALPAWRWTTGAARQQFLYCLNPVVGTGHTFTVTGTATDPTIIVHAFSGVGSYQNQTGASAGAFPSSPLASGSVTPVANGALILTALGSTDPSGTDSVTPAGFTVTTHPSPVGMQESTGYVVQSPAAAINPTWAWTGSHGQAVAATVVFLPVGAPTAPVRVNLTVSSFWTGFAGSTWPSSALAVTAGNLLVVAVGAQCSGGESVTGITDTAGNTYIKIDHVFEATEKYREELWYAKNILGHAANVVTPTWSGAVPYRAIAVAQYSGLDPVAPFDGTAKGAVAAGAGSTVTTSTLTTTRNNDIHVLIPRWGVAATYPAGFAELSADANAFLAERFVASPYVGTYTITQSASFGKLALVAAFAPVPIASPAVAARVTQLSVDVFSQSTGTSFATQLAVEVYTPRLIPARLTQIAVETFDARPARAHDTQLVVEVFLILPPCTNGDFPIDIVTPRRRRT